MLMMKTRLPLAPFGLKQNISANQKQPLSKAKRRRRRRWSIEDGKKKKKKKKKRKKKSRTGTKGLSLDRVLNSFPKMVSRSSSNSTLLRTFSGSGLKSTERIY
jgi:hypothetical protein